MWRHSSLFLGAWGPYMLSASALPPLLYGTSSLPSSVSPARPLLSVVCTALSSPRVRGAPTCYPLYRPYCTARPAGPAVILRGWYKSGQHPQSCQRVWQHSLLPPLSPSSSAHLLSSVAGADVAPPIARLAVVAQSAASHDHTPCDGRWHRLLICILAVVTPIARPSTAQDTGSQVPNCHAVASMFLPVLPLVLPPAVVGATAGAAPLCGRQPTYLAPSIHI